MNTNPEPYQASVLADSIADGVRLTTLVVKIPRIVLAEFNTHRVFSRNSASSRAIPVKKRIASIREQPYIPLKFGKNKSGMQAAEDLEALAETNAEIIWKRACEYALEQAESLADIGVHKQLANRIIEPYSWQTVIVTATEWANYWALRISEYAQPEIRIASENMRAAMEASTPKKCCEGDWHLPLVDARERAELDFVTCVKISAARCARVSYLTHGGERDIDADIGLYDKLRAAGHMSPFEHPARVTSPDSPDRLVIPQGDFHGNFRLPWFQHRKMLAGESVYTQ